MATIGITFTFFFLMIRRPPRSTHFPYTTPFQSHASDKPHACDDTVAVHVWQGTRMHYACDSHAMSNGQESNAAEVKYRLQLARVLLLEGNNLLRQAFPMHIASVRQTKNHRDRDR